MGSWRLPPFLFLLQTVGHALTLVIKVVSPSSLRCVFNDNGPMAYIGHESYPNKFDVDMKTQLLGTVKPYHRQVRTTFHIYMSLIFLPFPNRW